MLCAVFNYGYSWNQEESIVRTSQYASGIAGAGFILKKLPALIMLTIIFVLMIYASGARSFKQGFINTFLLWSVIKLYVVFVLDCGWLAHTPSAWIPGTEDMKECYQDYVFYMKSIPRSLIAGLVVAALVGLAIEIIV